MTPNMREISRIAKFAKDNNLTYGKAVQLLEPPVQPKPKHRLCIVCGSPAGMSNYCSPECYAKDDVVKKEKPKKKRKPKGGYKTSFDYKRFAELYNSGKSDGEIGKVMYLAAQTIAYRRRKYGLPANVGQGGLGKVRINHGVVAIPEELKEIDRKCRPGRPSGSGKTK